MSRIKELAENEAHFYDLALGLLVRGENSVDALREYFSLVERDSVAEEQFEAAKADFEAASYTR